MTTSRRDFLTFSQNNAIASSDNADILIYIFQRGAADGMNLVVPYGDDDYYINRPTVNIPKPNSGEGSGIDLDGFFALNPSLAALLPIYQAQDLAMIHAFGANDSTHSHFKNQAYVDRGALDTTFADGWLARYVNSTSGNDSAFKSVAMSASIPPSLAGAEAVVALNTIEGFQIVAPESESEALQLSLSSLYSGDSSLDLTAQATFSAVDLIADINPEDYPVEYGAQYPNSGFANKLKDLAVLIKSGIGIETASVDIGGWDTHNSQADDLNQLAQDYADSVAAFYTDMKDYMANISMITLTEFGRRAAENGSAGTDHGTASVSFVMGGGVNGGQVYRDWPGLSPADLVGPGDLAITTDYRTVIAELLDKRLNFQDIETVFPDFEVPEYLGIFTPKS